MDSSLPLFEQFKVHTDPHTAGVRWRKWIDRLERLLEALDITEKANDSAEQKAAIDKRRLSLLLYYAGPEVIEVYETLAGNKNTYSLAKPLFATYFEPKKNVELEIFNFRRMKQESEESMDAFVLNLRQQAKRCNFTNTDLEIKLQIIQGCKSSSFRKACLRDNLTLDKMLENARSAEAANRYAESIEQSSKQTTNAVKKFKNKNNKQTGRHGNKKKCRDCGGQWPHANSACPGKGKCRNCGMDWPHAEANPCPAKGKKCNVCGKLNHFAKMCKSTGAKAGTKQAAEKTRLVNDQEISSSDESTWAVNKTEKSDPRPFATIKFCDEKVRMMIDTGSTCNLISKEVYTRLKDKPRLLAVRNAVNGYGGNALQIEGKFKTLVESKHAYTEALIYVSSNSGADCLLSYETAKSLKLVEISNAVSQPREYLQLKEKYAPLFNGLGKMKNYQVKLHIDPSVPAVTQKHRRIGFHLREAVADEIDKLLKADIIEPVNDGPTPWISPCIAVPKPKQPGKLRICVDMRAPNKAILRTRLIIPYHPNNRRPDSRPEWCNVLLKTGYESRISPA